MEQRPLGGRRGVETCGSDGLSWCVCSLSARRAGAGGHDLRLHADEVGFGKRSAVVGGTSHRPMPSDAMHAMHARQGHPPNHPAQNAFCRTSMRRTRRPTLQLMLFSTVLPRPPPPPPPPPPKKRRLLLAGTFFGAGRCELRACKGSGSAIGSAAPPRPARRDVAWRRRGGSIRRVAVRPAHPEMLRGRRPCRSVLVLHAARPRPRPRPRPHLASPSSLTSTSTSTPTPTPPSGDAVRCVDACEGKRNLSVPSVSRFPSPVSRLAVAFLRHACSCGDGMMNQEWPDPICSRWEAISTPGALHVPSPFQLDACLGGD